MVEISTSILSVKKDEIIKKISELETSGTDFFHIDVMDGKFVENNTTDLMLLYSEYIKQISNIPLDIHLMVQDIKTYIESYLILKPGIITFHLEACNSKEEVFEYIKLIKENNCKVGISIKPNTNIEKIKDFLPYIHLCLVMTVEPGKGGQKLIDSTMKKIEELKKYITDNNLDTFLEADGGINLNNIEMIKKLGTDIVVSGSAIIESKDCKKVIYEMKSEK